jgi:hypothetical protein
LEGSLRCSRMAWAVEERRTDEVRLPRGRGALHPVGEPSVRQRRQALERQWPTGAVVAQPLEADDVVLVEPGVGVEGEALDEGTAATRTPGGRTRSTPWHLDAFELEDCGWPGAVRSAPRPRINAGPSSRNRNDPERVGAGISVASG